MLIFHRSNYLDIVQKRKKWEIEVQVCYLEIWRYLPEEIFKSIERTCFLWRRVVFFLPIFLLFFKYSFLPFPTTLSHRPSPPHLLPPFPAPLVIVYMSFIIVPVNPSPFPPIIRYFILFVAIMNGIVFLISISDISLLAYKNATISVY